MRRAVLTAIVALLLLPAGALANSWHTFSSKQYGFTVRYPSSWTITAEYQPGSWQLTSTGHSARFSLTIAVLPIKAGRSLADLKRRFIGYERASGNVEVAGVRWSSSWLGGKPALEGILRLSTEGGAPVTNGFYVAASPSRVYQMTLVSIGKTRPASVAQFPPIYGKIVATWRFR